MKTLTVSNPSVTKQALLEMAQQNPSTWLGIRIAAGLLVLNGWTSSQIAELFEVSRWTAVQWIQRLNNEGVTGLLEKERSGRPVNINKNARRQLKRTLSINSRKAVDLSRDR